MRICSLLVAAFLCAAGPAVDVEKATDHYYNLEYDEAIGGLRVAVRADPENPRYYNDLAQALIYREMYLSSSLESELAIGDTPLVRRPKLEPSPEILEEMEVCLRRALTLAEQRLAQQPDDSEALYELGVAHGGKAFFDFAIRKAWIKGLRAAAKSRQLHNKLVEQDPDFVDARLTQGVHDYLISQLSFPYKLAGSFIGFRGNRRRGIETIELVAHEGQRRRVTAQMLLAVVYRREDRPEMAVPLLLDLIDRYPRNHLIPVELAHMYADAGDMSNSMGTLDEIAERIRDGAPGFTHLTVNRVNFLRGHIQFRHHQLVEAATTLTPLLDEQREMKADTRALAGLRLGQTYDLLERRQEALAAYQVAVLAEPLSAAARLSRRYQLSPYRDKKVVAETSRE